MSERVPESGSFYGGVTTRYFPLMADPSTLQDFIDRYLNYDGLQGEHYFRSANSYVILQVLNYNRMAPRASRLGYISQNEVLFGVPLLWYRKNPTGNSVYNGIRYELVKFRDASMAPFLLVDNDLSVIGGRELYGWPKQLMEINSKESPWLQRPAGDELLLDVRAFLFDRLYAGRARESLPLIEIRRKSQAHFSLDYGQARWLASRLKAPISGLVDWADVNQHRIAHEAYWYKEFSRQIDPMASHTLVQLAAQARAELAAHEAWQARPLLGRETNNIGLRQFMFSDDPTLAAYQALGNSVSRVDQIRGFGTFVQIGGDLSGGIEVHLSHYGQMPIARDLGLISSREAGASRVFRPVMPGWMDLDMVYSYAEEDPFLVEIHGQTVKQDRTNLPAYTDEYSIGMKEEQSR